MTNRIVWFDLPVADIARGMEFYSAVLAVNITEEFPDVAVFSHTPGEVSGCLVKNDEHIPSTSGPLIYFNVNGRLQAAVDEVEKHGGRIEKPPHEIGPYGMRAIVFDSEGNRIALHSE